MVKLSCCLLSTVQSRGFHGDSSDSTSGTAGAFADTYDRSEIYLEKKMVKNDS